MLENYSPEHPSMFHGISQLDVSHSVFYELNRFLKTGSLDLVLNNDLVGRVSSVCGCVFVFSNIINGIIAVQTCPDVVLGHLIVVHKIAQRFLPVQSNFKIDAKFIQDI